MQTEETEVQQISGVVQALAQSENRYSIKVGGEWYGGFGTCPARKGSVYLIEYTLNGSFRNIKSIREVGEPESEEGDRYETRYNEAVPVAVSNYRTEQGGWSRLR